MAADRRFKPQVLVVVPRETNLSRNADYQFFRSRKYSTAAIFDGTDLRAAAPDLIFYQQPWFALDNDFAPEIVSEYALCFYFPYAISTTIELPKTWDTCQNFFRNLFRHFVFCQDIADQFSARGVHNTVATGHPKMDAYGQPVKSSPWHNTRKFKIIYAPHHTFDDGSLKWATFQWNGKELLAYAKKHKNTEWIIKPHPWFQNAVIRAGIMTAAEVDRYFNEWRKIGQVYESGDYFDMFRTADLLITDCGSFLTEWLPTGKPCIHLIQNDNAPWSLLGRKYSAHYYKTHNLTELKSNLDMLIIKKQDPMAKLRRADAAGIFFNAADNIYNHIIKELVRK